jgi:hypothetical protein
MEHTVAIFFLILPGLGEFINPVEFQATFILTFGSHKDAIQNRKSI